MYRVVDETPVTISCALPLLRLPLFRLPFALSLILITLGDKLPLPLLICNAVRVARKLSSSLASHAKNTAFATSVLRGTISVKFERRLPFIALLAHLRVRRRVDTRNRYRVFSKLRRSWYVNTTSRYIYEWDLKSPFCIIFYYFMYFVCVHALSTC